MSLGLLSSLVLLPLLGALLVLALPEDFKSSYKWISIVINALNLLTLFSLYSGYKFNIPDYQFVEHFEWIRLDMGNLGVISIDYILGVDGISFPMLILSVLILLIGNIASFSIEIRPKAYYSFYLLLCSSVIGCFVAIDFFLFFIFFEFMLLPMYFLIGIWGGENREYASLKFIIYTLVGSIFIFLVMIVMGMSTTDTFFSKEYQKIVHSFDFRILSDSRNFIKGSLLDINNKLLIGGIPVKMLLFGLLFLGFGIKLPMVPFHTWLPDAHVEAPTPISVVLAGVLLKIGAYGMIRIAYGFFPEEALQASVWIGVFGVISIIYGALNALGQRDLKKLIAYSSVSHMGFVLLGLAAYNKEGFSGAIYQMFSHGLLSAMLFLCVGVIYDRTHNRLIENFRGLAPKMPYFTILVMVAFFGSLGLPTLPGFIGEFFTVYGGLNSTVLPLWIPMISVVGIVLSAVYFLWTFQKMFFGVYWVNKQFEFRMKDLNLQELVLLAFLAFLSFIIGIFPNLIFDLSSETINSLPYLK